MISPLQLVISEIFISGLWGCLLPLVDYGYGFIINGFLTFDLQNTFAVFRPHFFHSCRPYLNKTAGFFNCTAG